jgi:hypothetical protein
MHCSWLHRAFQIAAALTIATAIASDASAQTVTFTGRVTSAAGQPLAGANVGITDLGVGSVATTDGRYTFTVEQNRLQGRTGNIVARFIGYKPKRLPVTI